MARGHRSTVPNEEATNIHWHEVAKRRAQVSTTVPDVEVDRHKNAQPKDFGKLTNFALRFLRRFRGVEFHFEQRQDAVASPVVEALPHQNAPN